MPALPFLAVGLASAGTFAAIGAGIAGIGGFTVAAAGTTASLAAGTISAAAATAIGAGTFAGLTTAIQGGSASDVLKSAVLGGVTSYAGSTIAKGIAEGVRAEAILSGTDPGIAKAMSSVVGGAVAGGITSGAAALLNEKDPLKALLKGGLSGAMGAAVGIATNAIVSEIPGLNKPPVNAFEDAFQRAAKTAIATTISTGGDLDKAKTTVITSFINSAANGIIGEGKNVVNTFTRSLTDLQGVYESEYAKFETSVYRHEKALADNRRLSEEIAPVAAKLQEQYKQYEPLYNQYEELKLRYDWAPIHGQQYLAGKLNPLIATLNEVGPDIEKTFKEYEDLRKELYDSEKEVRWSASSIELQSKFLSEKLTAIESTTRQWVAQEEKNATFVKQEIDKWIYANDLFEDTYGRSATEKELNNFAAQGDIVEQVASNIAEYRNNLFAKERGFKSYEEAEEEGVISPDEFYAQTAGWESQADKLVAEAKNIDAPEQFDYFKQQQQEATNLGFESVEDYVEAKYQSIFDKSAVIDDGGKRLITANEFYAKQEGWESYQQKLDAEEDGFLTPEAFEKNFKFEYARSQGFTNYYDYEAAEGLPAKEYYDRQQGWASSEQKAVAQLYGVTNPYKWQDRLEKLYVLEDGEGKTISVEDFAKDLGFKNKSDYIKALGDNPVGKHVNANEYYAEEEGWKDYNDKKLALKNGIDTPDEWYESAAKKKADQEAYLSTLSGVQRSAYIRQQELKEANDKYADEIAKYKKAFGSSISESKLLYHSGRGTLNDFVEKSIQNKIALDKGFDTYGEYINALVKNPNAGWDNYADKQNAYKQKVYDALDWDQFKESDFDDAKDFLRARSLNINTPDELTEYDEQLKQQQAEAEAIRAAEQETLAEAIRAKQEAVTKEPPATTEQPVVEDVNRPFVDEKEETRYSEKETEDIPVIKEVKPLPDEIIKEISNLPVADQTTPDPTETQDVVDELLNQETEEPSALDVLGQPLTPEAEGVTPDIVTPEEPVTKDIEKNQEDQPATYTITDEFGFQYVLDYSGNLVDIIPPEQEPTPEDIIFEVIPEDDFVTEKDLNLDVGPETDQPLEKEQITEKEENEIVHSQKNDDGSATYIFDDGSSLTINPDGSVRDFPESTDDIVLEEQEEEAAPPGGFVGPLPEDKTNRFNEEFARYLDYLAAGQPPPPDYGVQDLGITDENWDSFNQNLLDMQKEGQLPTQWKPNQDGTFTYTGDDGDTLTINSDGSIVGYTEAPMGNLPGETPGRGGTSGGGGTIRPPAPPTPASPPKPTVTPAPPALPAKQGGIDMAALLALFGGMGQSAAPQQVGIPQSFQTAQYAETPEFDIVQAFAPTLYAERKKAENPYLSGLNEED